MAVDGIIFDLDGTLWDSCRVVAESWTRTMQQVYGSERVFTVDDIKAIMGLTATEIGAKLFPDHGDRAMELCLRCMDDELDYISDHSGDVYPGVEEMLSQLSRRWPLFIVSNCQTGYVEAFLTYSGFGKYFKDYEYLGRQGLSKAENIRLIIERHALGKCVYVGDTAHDAKSAHSAGCDFVFAAYGFGKATEYEAVIESPAELPSVLSVM